MSRRLFGTDGIRGVANEILTPELAFELGQGAGLYMLEAGQIPRVVLGRDTRRSGPMIGAALAAGFCSVGVDVTSLGVMPTGGISYVTRTGNFGMGGVISASHNPAPDNGIKLIAGDGRKVSDAVETRIEALMYESVETRPVGSDVGTLVSDATQKEVYLKYVNHVAKGSLEGMKVAVDGANGAAHELGPEVLRILGAEVFEINVLPDGMNINEGGGATKPRIIQEFTVEMRADIGVAFDGDADRAVFSDSKGRLINGDRMMGIWAANEISTGGLDPAVVVGTVMSNGGFEAHLASFGVRLERAPVGDKYVFERMLDTGARIGGEQSGHIIFPQWGPTGDGLITAIELLRVIRESGRKADQFMDEYEPWPQILVNVNVGTRDGWKDGLNIKQALSAAEAGLEGRGRVNVRPSGTQPMIRVMVEADDISLRDESCRAVVNALIADLGGEIYSSVDLTHALGD